MLKDHLPTKAKAKHHKAVPYAELPAFMTRLAARNSLSARALEFTILTAVRTQEAIGAKWSEIDLEAATWTIPAARMKAKRDHRVALSKRAVAVLKALPRKGATVFKLSNMAMLQQLRGLAGNGYTVHGFRSAFSDWARDRTEYPRDVIEMALAHAIKDKSEAAYRRGDALEKRRKLMADWCDCKASPDVGAGRLKEVTQISRPGPPLLSWLHDFGPTYCGYRDMEGHGCESPQVDGSDQFLRIGAHEERKRVTGFVK